MERSYLFFLAPLLLARTMYPMKKISIPLISPLRSAGCWRRQPTGYGNELVVGEARVRERMPLKTHHVEKRMHIESFEANGPPVGEVIDGSLNVVYVI
ncbi:hypothetical protein TNCV_1916721 [Trichonephila clavipes]|uniref:Uncharacterized protein n=1 Tax=Trichonephila clavipes TaxID=2585209 RepID=A0A8X7BCZ1_TRICX|nr:hypothetical protein TNCV_1916721 [Trichonephila clavipes]